MGSARARAWSHSRQGLYDRCPRAYFFQYFLWGEPEEDLLWFLRRAKTAELLAGTIVHDFVTLALRRFKEAGHVLADLHVPATARYDMAVAQSARIAEAARRGRWPPDHGDVLLHHLRTGPSELMDSAARASVEDALRAFEASDAWAALRASDPRRWVPLVTDMDERPHFLALPELGFEGAHGLRVYAVYDLALRLGKEFVIVDWKTGRRTEEALANARRQGAAYARWALGKKVRRERLRAQPYFLTPSEAWDPQPIEEEELDAVRRAVERHDAAESALVELRTGADGRSAYFARREDFPARPRPRLCDGCRFRTLCPEAKEADVRETVAKRERKGRPKRDVVQRLGCRQTKIPRSPF